MKPIHPGEMLKEEFLAPLNMSANALAAKTGLAASRISEIIRGRRGISADTAIRLSEEFGNSAEFWMNLQSRYDLSIARQAAEGVVWPDDAYVPTAHIMGKPLNKMKSEVTRDSATGNLVVRTKTAKKRTAARKVARPGA